MNQKLLATTISVVSAEIPNTYGDAFGRFVSAQIKRWAEGVKVSGAKLD